MKRIAFVAALFAAVCLSSSSASAGVWLELLHAPCWIGDKDNIDPATGEVPSSVDCFNQDFNGDASRTLLSIKAFQPWEYGTFFMYYDITGPTNSPASVVTDNERNGFFGAVSGTLSIRKIVQKLSGAEDKPWGPLADLSLKYELEHVSKFGALHYYGLQYDFVVPFVDFLSAYTVVRDDRSLDGVAIQVGAASQKSFSIAGQDFILGGFFSWGLFGEGEGQFWTGPPATGTFIPTEGNWFFLSQPQFLWDLGKTARLAPAKLYIGFEYQIAFNRYLIENKTENTLQGMIRWNI